MPMDLDAVLLSRIQFAFTITFHIIFPSFTIGLAAWLALLEGRWLLTGNPYYRQLFGFWLKVFGVSFGMGVVSGIVMAFQFGTNWAVLSERTGPIQGPLLGYETFTAFLLEATFFGVMLFGRNRVAPWFYWLSCCMVALGTTFSAYWILMNNSWMQVPLGYEEIDGRFVPTDWAAIAFSKVAWLRFMHMLIGAYLTSAMCIAAAGAWLLLRGRAIEQSRIMMRSGLGLVAVLIWPQMILGHFNGDYVHEHQPAKFAAIEARWEDEQPASEVIIGIPDPDQERNLYAIEIPRLGSFIASGTWDSREVGLKSFAPEDRPPVLIPFFGFRIMVGMALLMWALSWFGMLMWARRKSFDHSPWFLWLVFLSFPSGFIAVVTGWYVAEVGRQPWVVYGLLRTVDSHSPNLVASDVVISLTLFVLVYGLIFLSGALYIYRILRAGPEEDIASPAPDDLTGSRPLAVPGGSPDGDAHYARPGE
jgi:cytochrome d ubiquinol oxidase subunit I